MIGDILNGIIIEVKKLFEDTGCEVLLKTDYNSTNLLNYKMPLVIIDIPDAPESSQYLGGLTKNDYLILFNIYHYEPDITTDDVTNYSTSLINITDTVRRHFSFGSWLTPEMAGLENDFGLRLTFSGVTPADSLDQDGLIKGFKIGFESISFDQETELIADSKQVLETVIQLDPDSKEQIMSITKKGFNILSNENVTGDLSVILPGGTYLDSSLVNKISGTPSFKVGTTLGAGDIIPLTAVSQFAKTTLEKLFTENQTLFVTITGGNIDLSFVVGFNIF